MRHLILTVAIIFAGASFSSGQESGKLSVAIESHAEDKTVREKTITLDDLTASVRGDSSQWSENMRHYESGRKGEPGFHQVWTCKAKSYGPPRKSLTSELDLFADVSSAEASFDGETLDMMKIMPGAVDWSQRVHLGRKCRVVWSPDLNSLYVSVWEGPRLARLSTTGLVFVDSESVEALIRRWLQRNSNLLLNPI